MLSAPLLFIASAGLLKPPSFQLPPNPFESGKAREGAAVTSIRKYFDAWNRRDMDSACECFSEDCIYDDTQYSDSFQGKVSLKSHLVRVVRFLMPCSCSPVRKLTWGYVDSHDCRLTHCRPHFSSALMRWLTAATRWVYSGTLKTTAKHSPLHEAAPCTRPIR